MFPVPIGDTMIFRVRCILFVRVLHESHVHSLTTHLTGFTVARREDASVGVGASEIRAADNTNVMNLNAFMLAFVSLDEKMALKGCKRDSSRLDHVAMLRGRKLRFELNALDQFLTATN